MLNPLYLTAALMLGVIAMSSAVVSAGDRGIRPPATPLIATDPYFSVWSMADRLTDEWPRHWTGANNGMGGLVLIDGKPFRFMGLDKGVSPMEQTAREVHPTRTIYTFEQAGVQLRVAFMTPLLPDDLDIMSRPASYIALEAESADGAEHSLVLYLDISGELVVNTADQKIVWSRHQLGEGDKRWNVLKMGSADQPVLGKSGDNLRIDWGYLYAVLPQQQGTAAVVASVSAVRGEFLKSGHLPADDDLSFPRSLNAGWPAMACLMDVGKVGAEPVERVVTLVYDDIFSIEYLYRKLRPYWRRNGMGINELIKTAVREYPELAKRCAQFDEELISDARKCGGEDYADIVTLAYRQAIAAHKLAADIDGRAMFFSKECFSNGCIATVDVSYPSAPMFLLFNTELLRGMLEPILEYASSPTLWPHDFAPHDLGTYPLANGQVYPAHMPVEESGNMLVMLGAMSHVDGNAEYAGRYWGLISKWAAYLKAKGMDPENQICTDDFMGHLAHNTNLSIKAIVGLACYAKMADMLGKKDVAAEYASTAKEMAAKWKQMASDGEHYRLAFDQPGTWSMKYNLVWDRILDLKLFDPSIARTEVASYLKRQNAYGLPLDNRSTITKGDWIVWTATLAENDADFRALVSPLRKFLNETPTRAPFGDRHSTTDGTAPGFRARSVVGGVYVKMLAHPEVWRKWHGRARNSR